MRGDTAGCVWQVLSCIKVSPCRWFTFNPRLKAAPDLAVSPSLDGRRELGTGAKLEKGDTDWGFNATVPQADGPAGAWPALGLP